MHCDSHATFVPLVPILSYFLKELEKCLEDPDLLAELFIKHVSPCNCQLRAELPNVAILAK